MIRWIAAACLILACSTVARAQTAGISGTVVDETGGGVPGATVQLTGPARRDLTTSGQGGSYRFAGLPAGAYQVTVSLVGFSQATRDVVVAGADVTVPAIVLERRQPERNRRRQRDEGRRRARERARDDERRDGARSWRARRRSTTATCCARCRG